MRNTLEFRAGEASLSRFPSFRVSLTAGSQRLSMARAALRNGMSSMMYVPFNLQKGSVEGIKDANEGQTLVIQS